MKDIFWGSVIKAATEEPYYYFSGEATERRIRRMRKAISALELSEDSLVELYLLAVQTVDSLDETNFSGACRLFWGGMSDDTFEDHCRWVVSLGLEQYSMAVKDPDTFYSSFIDENPHPVSPFFESVFRPFTDEIYEREIDENEIEFNWPRGGGISHIPVDDLRERFPKIAKKLDQHECDYFDSLCKQAEETCKLIEQETQP